MSTPKWNMQTALIQTPRVGSKATGNSVRAWLSNTDLEAVRNLSDRTGLKAVEIHNRILAAANDRAKNKNPRRRAACLDYPDKIELSEEAERDPKAFIQKQLAAKRELYR